MLYERLYLMRDLMAEGAAIYVHLDERTSHYVKVMLDEVLGRDGFVNEIVWQSTYSHPNSKYFGSIHQTIFYYAKGDPASFNVVFDPYDDEYIENYYRYKDPD